MRGDRRSPSFWVAVIRHLRLAWRLFWDRRVPLWAKLVPMAALAYVVSPVDFLPDFVIGLGQLDDLTLFLLSTQVFTLIVPRSIIEAILEEMDGKVIDGEWQPADPDRRDPPPQLPKSE
jgi:uncharacterized membrane protein YkvA (DUF1232 family)